jgi:carbamate kinase
VTPEYLLGTKTGKNFPGSMGPKIEAAIRFVEKSTNPDAWAAIGDLKDAAKIANNEEGTIVRKSVEGNVIWRERAVEEDDEKPPPRLSKDPPKYG